MQTKTAPRYTGKDASRLKIGIVVSQYYWDELTNPMLKGAKEIFIQANVKEKNITIVPVSGSWEIPYGCVALLKKRKVDVLVTLGVVIKGETAHDHHLTASVMQGLMNLMLERKIPIALGVVSANNLDQAIARATGPNNKGRGAAIAALEMALLKI